MRGAIVECLRRPRPEVYPLKKSRALPILNAVAPASPTSSSADTAGAVTSSMLRRASLVEPLSAAERRARADELSRSPRRSRRPCASAAGGRLLVGGWVRDRLLGIASKDIDLEVFGLPPGELRETLERFGDVNAVGESFKVYKVAGIDVAMPRRESKIGAGHRGFEVTGDPYMPVEEAARRRDFTVNAIALDPLTNEYLDPFDGRRDLLERRTLRACGRENVRRRQPARAPRRTVRGAFRPHDGRGEPRRCARRIPLDDLPAERIWGEVEKLLLLAPRPSEGFTLALDLGVIQRTLPELEPLVGCPQEPEWHPEGDVWVHTLMVIDQARTRIDDLDKPEQVTVMLGAVCHDLGKPATTAFIDGRIRSLDHEQAGVAPTLALLDRLNVQTIAGFDVRQQVVGHRRQSPCAQRVLQVEEPRSAMVRSGGSRRK